MPNPVPSSRPATGSASAEQFGSGTESRRAAAEILTITLEDRSPLDHAMEDSVNFGRLSGRDRAFARAMASAALRYLGPIDSALEDLLERPLPTEAEGARALLRIGAAQIAVLETPVHAAVGATVDAAKSWRQTFPFAGLINAVLRRFAREKIEAVRSAPPEAFLPPWLATRWRARFGEVAFAALTRVQTQEAPVDLTFRDSGRAVEWAQETGAVLLPNGSVRLARDSGPVSALPSFAEGEFWVQDAAASLPARLLHMKSGESVADLCAAPGGKTLQLAVSGAEVKAVDRSAARLRRLEDNLDRTGLIASLVKADGAEFGSAGRFDAVLVDAPCLATGTIRRHPEAPWIKSAEDLAELLPIQWRLLHNAARILRPGGRLVYCVCSREPEEGREQIARVLREGFPGKERLEFDPIAPREFPGLEGLIDETGALDTNRSPGGDWESTTDGLDGFYAARLVKR